MFFFFKKSKLHIDAFTENPNLIEYYPVALARNFIPQWWKDLDKDYVSEKSNGVELRHSTIKGCSGFIDLYKKGFMIPLWSDLYFETKLNGSTRFISPEAEELYVNSHNLTQVGQKFNNFIHMKILSPWFFEEKSGVNFHFSQPYWNTVVDYDKIHIVPGVINYKYQHASHINLFVPRINNTYLLPTGLPIAHIIPLTEKDIKIHFHVLSKEEFRNRFERTRSKFKNNYLEKMKIKKSKEHKCPFRFFH